MSVELAEVLVRAEFVWGSIRLGRILLGGFKVDFESVWVGLELMCAFLQ